MSARKTGKKLTRRKAPEPSVISALDVAILGGGSFGTALGNILGKNKKNVALWVKDPKQAREINEQHTNETYHPGIKLSKRLRATTDLAQAVCGTPVVIMALPSKAFRQVARQVGDIMTGEQILITVTKGIEMNTGKRMSEILREETCVLKMGALSGPNLAKEIMAGDPSGALVASHYQEVVETVQALFRGSILQLYGGRDVAGTEIGGAFKNIVALMAGISAGLGYGDNTRSLIITRGLYEMAQYGVAQGAELLTFGGLAGIGDLMATCASPLSRNHQVGRRLAAGEKLKKIVATQQQVAEGIPTTKAVYTQTRHMRLKFPIVEAMYQVLYEDRDAQKTFLELMRQPVGQEIMVRLHVP